MTEHDRGLELRALSQRTLKAFGYRSASFIEDGTLAGRASMSSRDSLGHDGQAHRAQQSVDRTGRASITLAPFSRRGSGAHPPFSDAPIEEHSHGLVPGERALDMVVQMRRMPGDDDDLPDHRGMVVVPLGGRRAPVKAPRATRRRGLAHKPRERYPRPAPTGGAWLGADFKALVAIETQGEVSQR